MIRNRGAIIDSNDLCNIFTQGRKNLYLVPNNGDTTNRC